MRMRRQGTGFWTGVAGFFLAAAVLCFPARAGGLWQGGKGEADGLRHGASFRSEAGGVVEGLGVAALENEYSTGTIELGAEEGEETAAGEAVWAGESEADGDGGEALSAASGPGVAAEAVLSAGVDGMNAAVSAVVDVVGAVSQGGDGAGAVYPGGEAPAKPDSGAASLAVSEVMRFEGPDPGTGTEVQVSPGEAAAAVLSVAARRVGQTGETPDSGYDAADPGDVGTASASSSVSASAGGGSGGARKEVGSSSDDLPRGEATALVEYARRFIGVLSYVRAGTSLETGADCSGFVQQLYKHFGITIPRDSRSQYEAARKVSAGELLPGDLIFYGSSADTINHVGIYSGDGTIIHSTHSGDYVRESNVFYNRPFAYGRFTGG